MKELIAPRGLLRYFVVLALVLLGAVGVVYGLAGLSTLALDSLNDRYMGYYKDEMRGVSSPWYLNGFHIVDEGFVDEIYEMKNWEKDVVNIGSSLSVISFQPAITQLRDDYEYRFLVCGNGCWKSDEQLYNLYKASGSDGKDDVVKLEVSFSTFRDMDVSITETVIAKWRRYKVNGDNSVTKTSPLLAPVSHLNLQLIRIQNVWEVGGDIITQLKARTAKNGISGIFSSNGVEEDIIIPGNFRNNYFNYDTVASNCHMTEDMQQHMEDLIERIDSEHTLVVEFSPLPKGLARTEYGKQLTDYIDNELTPFLEQRGIRYLDYRTDYEDDEFCDGVHLGYDAGVRYTRKLTADLDTVIGE